MNKNFYDNFKDKLIYEDKLLNEEKNKKIIKYYSNWNLRYEE